MEIITLRSSWVQKRWPVYGISRWPHFREQFSTVTVKKVIGSSCSVRKSEVAAIEGSGLAGVHCILNTKDSVLSKPPFTHAQGSALIGALTKT